MESRLVLYNTMSEKKEGNVTILISISRCLMLVATGLLITLLHLMVRDIRSMKPRIAALEAKGSK